MAHAALLAAATGAAGRPAGAALLHTLAVGHPELRARLTAGEDESLAAIEATIEAMRGATEASDTASPLPGNIADQTNI